MIPNKWCNHPSIDKGPQMLEAPPTYRMNCIDKDGNPIIKVATSNDDILREIENNIEIIKKRMLSQQPYTQPEFKPTIPKDYVID